MSNKLINKILGLEDEYDEIEEEEDAEEQENRFSNYEDAKQNKIVNIHTANSTKVVIVSAERFEDAADICDNVKNRKIVVVNTRNMENKVAQRLIDFIGGAAYVLRGSLQEIEKNIYILAPSNVRIDNELKNELSDKGLFKFSL